MAEPLWTIGDIVSATRGASLGSHATPVAGLSIDSRCIADGECFVAIRGPNRDGHSFVQGALAAGAACAIVDGSFPSGDEERLVRVEDTLEALNAVGRAARDRATDAVVIGVTRKCRQDRHQGGSQSCTHTQRLGARLDQVV